MFLSCFFSIVVVVNQSHERQNALMVLYVQHIQQTIPTPCVCCCCRLGVRCVACVSPSLEKWCVWWYQKEKQHMNSKKAKNAVSCFNARM